MIRPSFTSASPSLHTVAFSGTYSPLRVAILCALAVSLGSIASAQVITIDTHGTATNSSGTVDRRFAQIQPTNVELSKTGLDTKTRLELIRVLQAEQGFAMRPFPRGHKGLTLEANGKLSPAGEGYLDMVTENGICAKPGDAVVLTDIKFDHNKIEFQLNGGPDLKHRFLRHVQLGTGDQMTPMVQGGDDGQPTGARLTLEFKGGVPAMTASQVKALLAPLISFDVKTPVQAYTDTLPPKLKEAILNHDVWVGMSTDMVLFAKGQPERKVREVDGQMPFEEWIYGDPPKPVEFVRINGNRVIRVEIAKVGEAPEIFTKDEVDGLMRTDGTPLVAADHSGTHTVQMGDVQRDPDKQEAAPPPTLTAPGEQLPDAAKNGAGTMRPVQFPTQKPDDYPDVEAARRADQAKAAEDAEKQKDQNGSTASDSAKPGAGGSSTQSPPAAGQGSGASPKQPPAATTTTGSTPAPAATQPQ